MSDEFKISINAINVGPHKSLPFEMSVKTNESVLFAGNGSGKTFLSRMFRIQSDTDSNQLSDRFLRVGEQSGSFTFSQTLTGAQDSYYEVKLARGLRPDVKEINPFLFHVFNSDFVKENLALKRYRLSDDITGMYVGKQAISLDAEMEELRLISENRQEKKTAIDTAIANSIKQLKQA
jgi:hypothetical protein